MLDHTSFTEELHAQGTYGLMKLKKAFMDIYIKYVCRPSMQSWYAVGRFFKQVAWP